MTRTLLLSAFFLTLSTLYAQNSNWKTGKTDHASFSYPPDWEFDQSGRMGTEFILFSPHGGEGDLFLDNVNFMMQDLSGKDIDLDQFVKITEEQVKNMATDGVLIKNERKKNGKQEYNVMSWSGRQGNFDLYFMQYQWVVNEKAYFVTFTVEQKSLKEFEATGVKIMDSLKLFP